MQINRNISPAIRQPAHLCGAQKRPGGLTAVCVISIVLGVLGLGSSLITLGSLAMQSTFEKAFKMPQQPGDPANFPMPRMKSRKKSKK